MRQKSTTLADIAQELGISKNAVSLALRGKEGVSSELRERVIAKAREMQYCGLFKAQGCILALIPQRLAGSESMFYHRLCFEMEKHASDMGYQLIISSVSEADEMLCRPPALLNTINCMAVITVGTLARAYCKMIYQLGIRYIMVDQCYDELPVDSVTTANTSGAYLLTSHLIENGHKTIQFFDTSFRTSSLEARWIGYKRAMHDHGLKILDNPLLHLTDHIPANFDRVERALNELSTLPTAFVCGHDITALDVGKALAKRGLRCPRDFSIVGFDNIQSYDVLAMDLTTYATPIDEIARTAIQLLQIPPNHPPRQINLFGEPIYRNSVRDIRE